MNLTPYENKGLSGLANLGNTCFMNTCLQVLSHTYELNILLDSDHYKTHIKDIPDSVLLNEWNELRKLLWANNCVIAPKRFVHAMHKVAMAKKANVFLGFSQNDVSEFILFLIDCFHTSLSREVKFCVKGKADNATDELAVQCFQTIQRIYTKDYSEIWNLFYAIQVSEISRLDDGRILSTTPEPFLTLDLPIPRDHKTPTLTDCLNLYVEGEQIDTYKPDDTKDDVLSVKKRIMFWSFPKILIIDLKRFNASFRKNQIHVQFPTDEILDLSPYVIGYNKHHYQYTLYGVCNHSGNVFGGHYTAYVRNANGKWYHFNDTAVREVSDTAEIVSSKAYVLFYRRCNSRE